jgi:acyl-CoA thioester hydrolase
MSDGLSADRRSYSSRWRVRTYELDVNGHVNNAVYLNYAEQIATEHAEAAGFGRDWIVAQGGAWVVRRHEIVYHQPARYGEELKLTTRVDELRGARGRRLTTIVRVQDGVPITDVQTEWVWVRAADGRPARVPPELVQYFGAGRSAARSED